MSKAAQLMNCNKASVSRHMRKCFARKIIEWTQPEATKEEALNVINALTASHNTTLKIMREALNERDWRTALMALQTELKQLDLMAKLNGQLSQTPQNDFLRGRVFVKLRQIVVKKLAPFPDARLALSEGLEAIEQDADLDGSN
jgi:hypothetical protein